MLILPNIALVPFQSLNASRALISKGLNNMQEKDVVPSEVILFGRSIGSGPTVELASKAEVRGIFF